MDKVHPDQDLQSSSSSDQYITSGREVFTVWMKSLVMNSNGCTVFHSNGQIVYRVDNYEQKCQKEVYIMDLRGKTLSTIIRKKLRLFGRWEGFRSNTKPWFQVRKPFRILKGKTQYCEVKVRQSMDQQVSYRMERLDCKLRFRIVDQAGRVVAEVKQKHSSSGVALGDDVLALVVEPNVDHLLIVGLLIVYGLIKHKL